jgi:hypothetical protein
LLDSNLSPGRRGAPLWLGCELCERAASWPHRRLRPTLVRQDQSAPPAAASDAAVQPALILLCPDCCALLLNAIDDDEWRRRIGAPASVAAVAARAANPSRVPLLL